MPKMFSLLPQSSAFLQFLPAGWAVFHFGKREFGEHSIYRPGGGGH